MSLSPEQQFNLASSVDKSSFAEAVGPSTICQKSKEESRPPVHWVRGRQCSVPGADPEEACEPASAPFACSLGALKNTDLDNHPYT